MNITYFFTTNSYRNANIYLEETDKRHQLVILRVGKIRIMNRRQALSSFATITGGAFLLPQFMMGCDRGPYHYALFQWGDTELLDEFAEFILPSTPGVPGAKEAGVGDFVQLYVTDCYPVIQQKAFLEGYANFKLNLEKVYNKHFIDLNADQKTELLTNLEAEANNHAENRKGLEPPHFYNMLKGTIMFGYFTSEIGATKALRYLPVPGQQKGEIPYNGERAWAL
jgi:hypothetical protein